MKYSIKSPPVPKREDLKCLYDLLNNICLEPGLFYTKKEVKKLKNNKTKIFL